MNGQITYGAPPRRRRTNPALIILVVVLAVGAVIAAAAVVMAAGGGGAPAGAATHPVGATVTDGGFTFRVASVKTREKVSADGDTRTAKGTFVLVSLDVTNNGTKPRFVFADDQQLRAGGKTYAVDTDATVDVDKGPEVGLPEKINPGAAERIVVVYDVPATAAPQAVELHGAQDSGGALVALPAT